MVHKTQPGNELIMHSKTQLDQITTELRNITYNLTPASLSAFGLATAVKEFLMKMQDQLPVSIYYEAIGTHQLTEASQVVLFRTIQEVINNSIRHSGCTEINVQLIADEATFRVMIEDNGSGFDLAKAFDKLQSRGLKNIYDRCSALGARLHIDTSPGNGTTVTIEMKIDA
jgi:signal transduction histidine kinase